MIELDIKSKFADIISLTKNRHPNYDVICFDKFLERVLSKDNKFIELDTKQRDVVRKRGNFKKYGVLSSVNFSELHFYQKDVGIKGPQHTNIDDPVNILKVGECLILADGYHRSLIRIYRGEVSVLGYVLDFHSHS